MAALARPVTPEVAGSSPVAPVFEVPACGWINTDPEDLIRRVRDRHASWNRFRRARPLPQALGADQKTEMKSLLLEVLQHPAVELSFGIG